MKHNRRTIILFCVLLNILGEVTSNFFWESVIFPQENTIVTTTAGKIKGSIVSRADVSYFSFKGIPYAAPPVGKLRFQPPVPHPRWNRVRDAIEHGNICANKYGYFGVNNTSGGHEDCLFLNVYTKSLKDKKPVMFWIFGGSYTSGSGNTDIYGPEHLLKKDVVVVTINHRLSAFGFLSTGDKYATGNQGLKDLVLGLKWVKDNIEKFGGNKHDVTIFGYSSGSASVHYLMISELAKGLFNKAIMQSGSSLMSSLSQLQNPRPQAELLANRLNIKFTDTKDLIEKLQQVPFENIRNVEAFMFTMNPPWALKPAEYVPCIEPKDTIGAFLTKSPFERMRDGEYAKIPLMIGSASFEGMVAALLFYTIPTTLDTYNANPSTIVPLEFEITPNSNQMTEAIKELQKLYFDGAEIGTLIQWLNVYSDLIFRLGDDRVVRFMAKDNLKKIFYYKFSFDGSLNFFKKHLGLTSFEGASHGDELLYLFEPYEDEFKTWIVDDRAQLMRERMTTMWTNFAKFGNPTPVIDGKIITTKWKPYTAKGGEYLDINDQMTNKNNLERLDKLNELLKRFTGHM